MYLLRAMLSILDREFILELPRELLSLKLHPFPHPEGISKLYVSGGGWGMSCLWGV